MEQQEMLDMHVALKRQKEDAFRQMEQERRDRERREQLRREHEESLSRPQARPKLQNVQQPAPRFVPKRKLESARQGNPFEPSDDRDEAVLNAYASRSAPDASLPNVPFVKRNGTYWLGQRRCDCAVVDNVDVVVILGNCAVPFMDWIEKAERVEGLRIKGLQSAQSMIYLLPLTNVQ